MKKFSFLFTAVCLMAIAAQGQVRFGINVGGNTSNLLVKTNDKDVDGYKANLGFQVGGMFELGLMKWLALQPEAYFMQNRITYESDIASQLDSKCTLYQLQVPVNVKVKTGDDDLRLYALAGPYLNLGLSGKAKMESNGVSAERNLYDKGSTLGVSYNQWLNRTDVGLNFGAGVEIRKFAVSVGYQVGLVNLSSQDDTTVKMNSFRFSLGYFF